VPAVSTVSTSPPPLQVATNGRSSSLSALVICTAYLIERRRMATHLEDGRSTGKQVVIGSSCKQQATALGEMEVSWIWLFTVQYVHCM
jgi:hypothetical protein